MYRIAFFFGIVSFCFAFVGAFFIAREAVFYYENLVESEINHLIKTSGEEWATVRANGLDIELSGLSPDEKSRFNVLTIVNKAVDMQRLIDTTSVLKSNDLSPPEFLVEILRNENRISLIGLAPLNQGRDKILGFISDFMNDAIITDILEEADYPIPEKWEKTLLFAIKSLGNLKRSKISISKDSVVISAVVESYEERLKYEKILRETSPQDVDIEILISSPRPVISPFMFNFSLENGVARLDDCSVDTLSSKLDIAKVLKQVGIVDPQQCQIGLGAPTPDWSKAVIKSIESLIELGGGSLVMRDFDISLIPLDDVDPAHFTHVIRNLEKILPEVFSFTVTLPSNALFKNEKETLKLPEFKADLDDNKLILSGQVTSSLTNAAIEAYATAVFAQNQIIMKTEVDKNLNAQWSVRVLAGIEALGELNYGSLILQPDKIIIRGGSADKDAANKVSDILAPYFKKSEEIDHDIHFDSTLLPQKTTIEPQLCEQKIKTILSTQKIIFLPNKANITADSNKTLDSIANVLRSCPDAEFEIQGYTDTSGQVEYNKTLSQLRAESVLLELLNRRILTRNFTAKGYGQDHSIADNQTKEGREKNRRIEFKLQ